MVLNFHPPSCFHTPPIVPPGGPRIPPNSGAPFFVLGSILGFFFGTLFWGLLERSWRPAGPKKHSWNRLLAALGEISREVSAILGSKRLPKGGPRGSQIGSKRRLELKTRFLQKAWFSQCFFMIFEVPGSLFGGQNRYKMASDCSLAA